MTCKCEDCAWCALRDINPAYMPDSIAKICFGNVWIMSDEEKMKERVCEAHTVEG